MKDWSGVYVPYCTGDVHFGTADNVTIPGDGVLPALTNQHFVGYRNMQKFIGHLVPTFSGLSQVLLTGASAGGFGAGLNYGMVQDSFGSVPVTVLDDSGPPFLTSDLPACIQKQWRELWGFDAALPSDCVECKNSDGSGLTDIVKYWHHKYPKAKVGLVSTMQDEVMRLFFGSANNSCASNNATALSLSGGFTAAQYTTGLQNLVDDVPVHGRARDVLHRRHELELPVSELPPAHLPQRVLHGRHEHGQQDDGAVDVRPARRIARGILGP